MANAGGDDHARGLYQKYSVNRTDGRDRAGDKHDGCEYYVLDLSHDPYAYRAIVAYARACALTHPQLCDDLLEKAKKIGQRLIEEKYDQLEKDGLLWDTRPREKKFKPRSTEDQSNG